jgi:hypothetical protein
MHKRPVQVHRASDAVGVSLGVTYAGRPLVRTFGSVIDRRSLASTRNDTGSSGSGKIGPEPDDPVVWDQASSSTATLRVRLGSTWTPGPIVVETVILRR